MRPVETKPVSKAARCGARTRSFSVERVGNVLYFWLEYLIEGFLIGRDSQQLAYMPRQAGPSKRQYVQIRFKKFAASDEPPGLKPSLPKPSLRQIGGMALILQQKLPKKCLRATGYRSTRLV
jgi:hypothetical protein